MFITWLTNVGNDISELLVTFVVLIILFGMKWQWNCGLCGKINTTNTFQYIFQMCNHEGI